MGLSIEREKVIKGFELCHIQGTKCKDCPYNSLPDNENCSETLDRDVLALLKEQEKKQIALQKKHVITWSRKKLYEAICETLLDAGELFMERTDNNEEIEFVFYVKEGR